MVYAWSRLDISRGINLRYIKNRKRKGSTLETTILKHGIGKGGAKKQRKKCVSNWGLGKGDIELLVVLCLCDDREGILEAKVKIVSICRIASLRTLSLVLRVMPPVSFPKFLQMKRYVFTIGSLRQFGHQQGTDRG
ncbi:hypothetical protein VNO77_12775 [Canavalia gladiata]|uniref:Uncharacterized protein n=1 Tax=Canavalia gladiata TaxID=3824 RepID=A0AAN9QPW7_CANGL